MDFKDILQEAGWSIAPSNHHHRRDGWEQFDCPFCSRPNKFHAGFNLQKNYVNCYVCGHHSTWSTLREIYGGQLPQPIYDWLKLAKEAGPLQNQKTDRPKGKLVLPKNITQLTPAHRKYLSDRGLNPDECAELWNAGAISMSSETGMAWRVFIPFYSDRRLVSWLSRSIQKTNPIRYKAAAENQEEEPHKQLLYGVDYVQHAMIICEGPMDVWRIGPGAVALCGLTIHERQLARMAAAPLRVVCFDSQPAAQRRAARLCRDLAPFDGRTLNVQLTAKDPGSAGDSEIAELRNLLI